LEQAGYGSVWNKLALTATKSSTGQFFPLLQTTRKMDAQLHRKAFAAQRTFIESNESESQPNGSVSKVTGRPIRK